MPRSTLRLIALTTTALLATATPAAATRYVEGAPGAGDPFYPYGGNVTTDDFIELSERESGEELDDFFEIWLSTNGRPEPGSW